MPPGHDTAERREEHIAMHAKITRKRFLLSLFGSTAAVLLDGCGGGGSSYGGTPAPMPTPAPPPSSASCGASGSAIAGNHPTPHVLDFAKTDLDSTTDVTYNIQGMADHNHTVTLTVAQLATLKAGGSVMVTSTTTNSHEHVVTVTCS
jgi:hypothetical protein